MGALAISGFPHMKPYVVLPWPDYLGPEAERLGSNTSGRSFPTLPGKLGLQRFRLCAACALRGRELALWNFELRQRRGSSSWACRPTVADVALHLSCRGG